MSARVDVTLADAPFDPGAELSAFCMNAAGDGAVVSFVGLTRGQTGDGAEVATLTLESYRGVTLASMRAIADDAAARFAVGAIRVIHRAGTMQPGEPIVFVAASSPHRRVAFEAADYLMDRLKTEAIFWKREDGVDGARWIEPTDDDARDRARWE
ncbi:MAG: molybdenum cofactor biosynthesis protein MoaE [Pseudomonadota bacterium]